jgi:hypothetical protein
MVSTVSGVSVLSTITTAANATSTTSGGMGSIQAILGNNSTVTAAATHILPITSTMANLGIPLTGSTAIALLLVFEGLRIMLHENWICKKVMVYLEHLLYCY